MESGPDEAAVEKETGGWDMWSDQLAKQNALFIESITLGSGLWRFSYLFFHSLWLEWLLFSCLREIKGIKLPSLLILPHSV